MGHDSGGASTRFGGFARVLYARREKEREVRADSRQLAESSIRPIHQAAFVALMRA